MTTRAGASGGALAHGGVVALAGLVSEVDSGPTHEHGVRASPLSGRCSRLARQYESRRRGNGVSTVQLTATCSLSRSSRAAIFRTLESRSGLFSRSVTCPLRRFVAYRTSSPQSLG